MKMVKSSSNDTTTEQMTDSSEDLEEEGDGHQERIYTFEMGAMQQGSQIPQYVAAITVNLIMVCCGCVMGWSSPTLPKLKQPDSFLPITDENGSWIGSLVPLGAAFGAFPAGLLAEKLGRKRTLLCFVIPFLISWGLITMAQSVVMIYVGRVIAGVAVGASFTVVPMYVGEIAECNIRGALGSFLNAFFNVGIFYAYVAGTLVSYQWLGVASLVPPCLFVVGFAFMPASPHFLIAKGNKDAANKALRWLRRKSAGSVAKEVEEIQLNVEHSKAQSSSIKDLFTRGNLKALYLSWGLSAFQQLSGINAILYYSTDIFKEAGGSLSSEISSIIVGGVLLGSSFFTPFLVERLGRRVLLMISAIGMALAQGTVGIYFYLKTETNVDVSVIGWLPIICLVADIALNSIGFGPLSWAVMGELFPSNIKGIASASTATFNWLLCFLITRFFQDIVDALGAHTAFWIFAGCCVLANAFVYFLLPETKGKTLQEIQDNLQKK